MIADSTTVAGIVIPSRDPLFLGLVAIHVVAGFACVVAGAIAMLSPKRRGRHTRLGDVYFRALAVAVSTMAVLAVIRWREDYYLFLIGCASFGAAVIARHYIRRSGSRRVRTHLLGMGSSYVFLLVAFYVDNGPHLPLWKDLPAVLYWLMPVAIGGSLILVALVRQPLARAERQRTGR